MSNIVGFHIMIVSYLLHDILNLSDLKFEDPGRQAVYYPIINIDIQFKRDICPALQTFHLQYCKIDDYAFAILFAAYIFGTYMPFAERKLRCPGYVRPIHSILIKEWHKSHFIIINSSA